MSQKKARNARAATTLSTPRSARGGRSPRSQRLAYGVAAVAIVGAVIAGVILSSKYSSAAQPSAAYAGREVRLAGRDPITGAPVDLAAYRGRPVVLNVWGSWCDGCQAEARDLEAFARAHPEAQIVGLDTQDTRAGARAFYGRYGWSHPSIDDPHGDLAYGLGIQGTPTTFFLDADGRIVTAVVGATDRAGFERGLAAVEHA